MRLTETQSRELLAKHSVFVTETFDKCGKLLSHVRFTLKDQLGEWCSRECRDGAAAAERHRSGRKDEQAGLAREIRKGGRPRKYETGADRQKACRKRLAAA